MSRAWASAILILALLLAPSAAQAEWSAEETHHSTKFLLRTNTGSVGNNGTAGGEAPLTLGIDVSALLFLSPRYSIGLGYTLQPDYALGMVPLSTFYLVQRLYFYGQGTRTVMREEGHTHTRHDNIAAYVGFEVANNNFYLGSNSVDAEQPVTGTSLSLNGTLGVDLRLSSRFDLNLEARMTSLALTAGDDRFAFDVQVISVGLSYLW